MPLSEYEQRMLEQMERQLRSDDPKLADALGSRRASGSRVLLGVVVLIVGMGMLVGGVALQFPWLGIAGFLAMFGGVWIALSKPRKRGAEGAPAGRGRPTASSRPARPSLMQRLEERWDKRRDSR